VTEIKDPNVAETPEEHIKKMESRLAELHKVQHTWLVTNPTVVPDTDPDFRALRQVIKKVQLDLEVSKRQHVVAEPIIQPSAENETVPVAVIENQPLMTPMQRQRSRFMMRK
jgi:hypothetical protein